MHSLYFDRSVNSINGVLTLHRVENGKAFPVFSKLPARSGQAGYTGTDWVPAKSPIPFGVHYLTCAPVPLWMEPVGTPFFMISTVKGTGIIKGPNGKTRTAVGLHLENRWPGSAGCVVLVQDTPARLKTVMELFDYIKKLRTTEPFITFHVL